MTLAWHIARKDFHLQRWVVLAWIVVSVINIVDQLIWPIVARPGEAWTHTTLPTWLMAMSLTYFVVLLLGIANIIQADRLVGTTAFWMTRPIPGVTLMGSKLLSLFLLLIVPSLAVEAILMAAFHVSVATILAALLQQAWTLAVMILLVAFGAAVTSNIVRLLLAIIGTFVGLYVLSMLYDAIVPKIGSRYLTLDSWSLISSDPTWLLMVPTLFTAGVLVAIWQQYRHRRRDIAIAIVCASYVICWLTMGVWKHVSLFGGKPSLDGEAWARDPAITSVHLVPDPSLPRGYRVLPGFVAAPVELRGLPPDYSAVPYTVQAEVRFPNGQVLKSGSSGPEELHKGLWATLLRIRDDGHQRDYRDRPGIYTGILDFAVDHHETLATMPLAVGAGYNDGTRSLRVSRLRDETDHCVINLDTSRVDLVTRQLAWPELVLRYRLRDGTELVDPFAPGRRAVASTHAALRYAVLPLPLLQAFDRDSREAEPYYPNAAYGDAAAGPPCAEITLSVERVSYVGHIARTLELRDFTLSNPHVND